MSVLRARLSSCEVYFVASCGMVMGVARAIC